MQKFSFTTVENKFLRKCYICHKFKEIFDCRCMAIKYHKGCRFCGWMKSSQGWSRVTSTKSLDASLTNAIRYVIILWNIFHQRPFLPTSGGSFLLTQCSCLGLFLSGKEWIINGNTTGTIMHFGEYRLLIDGSISCGMQFQSKIITF